jgi:hypothetical protein
VTPQPGTIYTFLKGKGLAPFVIAGAMGNMQVESGFDPLASNPNEGAIGICQWEKGRRTLLQTYASIHNLTETDIAAQLGYMWQELNSSHPVLPAMAASGSASAAANIWNRQYENSGDYSNDRENNAETIYAGLQNGQVPTGGSTVTVPSSTAKNSGPGPNGYSTAKPDPKAPYKVGSLKAPLSKTQIATIETYLKSQGYSANAIAAQNLAMATGNSSQADFITIYETVVQGGVWNYNESGVSSPYSGPGSNIRIGLFVLGGVIIIFAVDIMFGNPIGKAIP